MRFTEIERSTGLYAFQVWALDWAALDEATRQSRTSYPPVIVMTLFASNLLKALEGQQFVEAVNRHEYNFRPGIELDVLERNLDHPQTWRSQ